MEYWSNGVLGKTHHSIIPNFHYSNLSLGAANED